MRPKAAALWRFLVVGGLVSAMSVLSLVVLVDGFGLAQLSAAAIVAVAGNVIGFVGNREWSFLARHERPVGQAFRYLIVAVAATVSSVGLFALLTEELGTHYVVASLVVSAVFAVLNFLGHFHWSFRRPVRGSS